MIGREEQQTLLNNHYRSEDSNLTIVYGRTGIGKTTLLAEFIKDKRAAYYEAGPGADFEQRNAMARAMGVIADDYDTLLTRVRENGISLIVVEEFQYLVKNDPSFMQAVAAQLRRGDKLMVVLSSSSVSWVENSMVRAIGTAAFAINTFLKLKELSYVDLVSLFPQCDATTILSIYALTGGVPAYLRAFRAKESVADNICRLYLSKDGLLRYEAMRYLAEEFRESGIYFTILYCLASGRNKLNEIHAYTGYGRDKISVYLKNLIEREIVEKVFSYDVAGKEHTRKGLYRIREPFLYFWFRYIYPQAGVLPITEPKDFYDTYIAPDYAGCLQAAYQKVAESFLTIMESMGRLPFACTYKGSFYGKTGDIHLIFESEDGRALIGNVFVEERTIDESDLEKMKEIAGLAGLSAEAYYLFSLSDFAKELGGRADVNLIRIEDL